LNLILFEPEEIGRPLARVDRRAVHILKVLRRPVGATFDTGIINGARGKATVTDVTTEHVNLNFEWTHPLPERAPASISLLVGLPRPQTARDILRDATTLGVDAIHFVRSEKSEPSYAHSTLWTSGEWRRHVIAGAEQAFETRIPVVTHGSLLAEAVGALPQERERLALDNYEGATLLGTHDFVRASPTAIAIGSERGWSNGERELLRAHGFVLLQLGTRILRTETAVTAALAIVQSRRGLM
jgi:16S rRNA (uracil1498-N3)-methyltransferase